MRRSTSNATCRHAFAAPKTSAPSRSRAWASRAAGEAQTSSAGFPTRGQPLFEGIEPGHRRGVELEIEDGGVLGDARSVDRLGEHDEPVLHAPAEEDLAPESSSRRARRRPPPGRRAEGRASTGCTPRPRCRRSRQRATVSRRCRNGVSSIWSTAGATRARASSSSRCGFKKLLTPIGAGALLVEEALEGAPRIEALARDRPVDRDRGPRSRGRASPGSASKAAAPSRSPGRRSIASSSRRPRHAGRCSRARPADVGLVAVDGGRVDVPVAGPQRRGDGASRGSPRGACHTPRPTCGMRAPVTSCQGSGRGGLWHGGVLLQGVLTGTASSRRQARAGGAASIVTIRR